MNARFEKSDNASLLTQTFCIAREFFLVSFGLDFDLVDCVPPGVVGVDGSDAESMVLTAVVSGDIIGAPTFDVSITLGGEALFVALTAFSCARRTAICFLAGFTLSLVEYLHARIASGTVDTGHHNKYVAVRLMRLSALWPLPDMLWKIFGQ